MHLAARLVPILLLLPIAVVVVLVNIYPYYPTTLVGWGVLLLLALPILLVGEFLGERVLGASFVARLLRVIRITYAVVIMGGTVASLMFTLQLLEGHLAKWGA